MCVRVRCNMATSALCRLGGFGDDKTSAWYEYTTVPSAPAAPPTARLLPRSRRALQTVATSIRPGAWAGRVTVIDVLISQQSEAQAHLNFAVDQRDVAGRVDAVR